MPIKIKKSTNSQAKIGGSQFPRCFQAGKNELIAMPIPALLSCYMISSSEVFRCSLVSCFASTHPLSARSYCCVSNVTSRNLDFSLHCSSVSVNSRIPQKRQFVKQKSNNFENFLRCLVARIVPTHLNYSSERWPKKSEGWGDALTNGPPRWLMEILRFEIQSQNGF